MPDYLPVKIPSDTLALVAGATITGGQVVAISAANTVTPTTAASAKVVGVAAYDVASGDLLTVHCVGVQETNASGTIAAGDPVESAAAGAVATHTLGTNDGNIIGIALTGATNGNKVRWLSR
jgi:hypothetical protein